jgi:succinate dehydrogenase/fumarate reductase cytochrome b subunit (b558 family)
MSDEAASPLDEETRRERRHFVLRRLHALSGIVPVGVFLVVHLWTNSRAIQGRTCFGHAVEEINRMPFLPVIEIAGIFLPLAFHAFYGVMLAFQSKQNVGRYGYARNWMFLLQRVSGLITLVFILFHLKDFRLAKLMGTMQHSEFFGVLETMLSDRWGGHAKALFYELGVLASVFHFANGLRTFLFSWGVTISAKSQRLTAWGVAGLGFVLWFLGTNTVLFFATGGRSFVPSSLVRGEGNRDLCEESLAPAAPAVVPAHPVAPTGSAIVP